MSEFTPAALPCVTRRWSQLYILRCTSTLNRLHAIISQGERDPDNNSQKEGKESGICGVCFDQYKLLRRDGKISKHGPRSNSCPGSYTDSTGPTGSIRNSAFDGDAATNTPIVVNYSKQMSSQNSVIASDHTLSHPAWTAKISRISRSARASCRSLLNDIISRIFASPNSKSAWNELLLYVPVILSKPKRESAKRNISNIINRWAANLDKDRPRDSIPPANNKRSRKDKNEYQHLAVAVRSKLEADNLKVALRVLCSEDASEPTNEAMLQELKEKNPGPASNRRTQ